ncbi:MAG TPA: DUF2497 domain-containing protein [Caulobacteraceae bacterium]|nr:DUF2497 domain-containing protein [Caulobacteraceae bacterium]
MAEQTVPEPTMEEILASIRRIISDDDQGGEGEAAEGWTPSEAAADADDDVLELTEPVGPGATTSPPPAEAAPAAPAASREAEPDALVGGAAAASAAGAFGRLKGAAAAAKPPAMAMPAPGRTLEDVTRELLRPLLKEWLDQNLAAIVQQRVDEEVERIARGRVR